MNQKPTLSFRQIWNLNFGLLGLQVAFTLLMANTSRILSALGANADQLPLLWLGPPIAGLVIQPIIGYLSDRKWTRFGRRIPFIFIGGIVSTGLMFLMPNTSLISHILPSVSAGVCVLFLLQAAFNTAMQPFRSLVGDIVNEKQQNQGYSTQTLILNIGGIIGNLLPFILTYFGVLNQPNGSEKIAATVTYSFYIGAVFLISTVLWTCFTVKEYSPQQTEGFNNNSDNTLSNNISSTKPERNVISTILRLGIVQFFSWFGIFFLWVYAIGGLAENIWNTQDPLSEGYNKAGNWFGVLSGFYSIVTVIFSIFLAQIAQKWGRKTTYAISLIIGALGLTSMYYIKNQYGLFISMVGVGIGWAAILTFPSAILASVTPPRKMGLYMGLLNATITVPQIIAGLTGGLLFKHIANQDSISMMLISGASLLIAAISVVFIVDKKKEV